MADLARIIIALAAAWCAAFLLVGLAARLPLFADGALFSYAVAAGDSWDFHFRQIPARAAAWLLTAAFGEVVGQLSGDAVAGVWAYWAAFLLAPALGLLGTWRADASGRILPFAASSTALLLPLVFGFPTEMWVAHAAFWPALALGWNRGPWPVLALALAITALSHEAGLLLACGAVALLALAPGWGALARGVAALLPALLGFVLLKSLVVPDPYVAEVMARVAAGFFDPRPLAGALGATLLAALAGWAVLSRVTRLAVPLVGAALLGWWLLGDAPLHAEARYAMRTPLFLGTALLAFLAVLHARGALPAWRVPLGAVAVVTLVHAGELARFTLGWKAHLAAVRALAAAPGEGFATVAELPPASAPFAWHSTVPFLSAMAAPGLAPARLVVDPASNYFWFGCAQARRNEGAARGVPAATRAQVTRHACAGRP